ncbi:MAG: OmpH family outer membrane protein [Dysgonamonadaceae bacterium]|jgi:outer membrane protein|nr:OmpH family outer membrane protein [Dysgonamonadaceae bacterium]
MFKKIVVVALLAFPVGIFAQDKIAYVNTQEVMYAMPETKAMQAELEKMQKQIETELKTLEDEFSKKYQAFAQQQDTLVESIKIRRTTELSEIRQRAESYQQDSQQQLYKKQQDLIAPIQKKLLDTIKVVAEENGYTYVMEIGAFLFTAPNATDATPLVKKKLGLQ